MIKKILTKIKFFLVFIPITTSFLSLTGILYLVLKKNYRNNFEYDKKELDEIDDYQNFYSWPILNKYDLYDYLTIKNKKAIINEEMMAKILNFIFSKIQIPYGDIQYNYLNNVAQNQFKISLQWTSKNNSYQKTYLFKIEQKY